jgi:hypothetical protein
MTRIGPRAYLSAGHCFANDVLPRGKVEPSNLFEPGKKVFISSGVHVFEKKTGPCPEQNSENYELNVPASTSKMVNATVRKVHFHPSYLLRGSEEVIEFTGEPPTKRFSHADVAILEVEEDFPNFAAQAKISFAPLKPGDPIVIGGHGSTGGLGGNGMTDLKFANLPVFSVLGADFFTKNPKYPTPGTGILPGDSGGPVYLGSDPKMLTVVGVNSKVMGERGSAYARMDDGSGENVRSWYDQTIAAIGR